MPAGSPVEVFTAFLRLGLTSFGGPIAHLSYFRQEFVARRRWLTDEEYAELVALAQFLPGPASSQVGFTIGLARAGGWGGVAAFVAFTMPSALLMGAFALGSAAIDVPIAHGLLAGLKVVAVAIIAQAVVGMARTLTPDARRATIAVMSLAVVLLVPSMLSHLAVIALGAMAGVWWCRSAESNPGAGLCMPVSRRTGMVSLTLGGLVLLSGPVVAGSSPALALFDAFYRAGSLVFGGGHVVLPLLDAGVVDLGWVSEADFLAGYGAAQAVPGPLFTVAAYLGAVSSVGPGGALGAVIALVGIFAPGLLLIVGVLPMWGAMRGRAWVGAAMRGVNAAVVGLLAAALYQPALTTAITGARSLVLAAVCFVLLVSWKAPPWLVVIVGAVGGILI